MNDSARTVLSPLRHVPFIGQAKPVVSLLDLNGAIGTGSRKSLSFSRLEKPIEQAFSARHCQAVVLTINSPGGSPVQSRLIHDAIRRQADSKEIPVLAFIEDAGASGGYMLAVAADEIFACEDSLIGSIGVVSGGFGFPEALERLGIERRVYIAGDNKDFLDPFQPERPADIHHLRDLLELTHANFIDLVKTRRGERLTPGHDDVFSGKVWTGAGALDRGLIDGLAFRPALIEERFGKDVRIKRIDTRKFSLFGRLGARASVAGIGHGLIDPAALAAEVEERLLWQRLGR